MSSREATAFGQSLPMVLHRSLDAVMPEYRTLFSQHDLTEQQWRVLRVLWEVERCSSAELATRTLLPSPSLVGIIDRLEKRELVARMRSTSDRRVVYVAATETGRALGAEVKPHVDAINKRIRSAVSDSEWTAMQATLEKIAAAIADDAAETDHDRTTRHAATA